MNISDENANQFKYYPPDDGTRYRYYIFYVKKGVELPWDATNDENMVRLYAWTDNYDEAKEFMRIRSSKKIKMKKFDLTKRELKNLIWHYHSAEIRGRKMHTKNSKFQTEEIMFYTTDREYTYLESLVYAYIENIWKYVLDDKSHIKSKYLKALNTLKYEKFHVDAEEGSNDMVFDLLPDYPYAYMKIFKNIISKDDYE